MSMWSALVVIVLIWGVVQVLTRRFDRDPAQPGMDMVPPHLMPSEDGAARREIEDLRERIKVLERIATDSNTVSASETRRIAQEIDALRDRQDG